MILNLLFIATSIPVVTLGASLTALNFTAMRIATGECGSCQRGLLPLVPPEFPPGDGDRAGPAGCSSPCCAAWYVVVTNARARRRSPSFVLLAIWYVLAFNFAVSRALRLSLPRELRGPARATCSATRG